MEGSLETRHSLPWLNPTFAVQKPKVWLRSKNAMKQEKIER